MSRHCTRSGSARQLLRRIHAKHGTLKRFCHLAEDSRRRRPASPILHLLSPSGPETLRLYIASRRASSINFARQLQLVTLDYPKRRTARRLL